MRASRSSAAHSFSQIGPSRGGSAASGVRDFVGALSGAGPLRRLRHLHATHPHSAAPDVDLQRASHLRIAFADRVRAGCRRAHRHRQAAVAVDVDGRDGRVGRLAVADADAVGDVGQRRHAGALQPCQRVEHAFADVRADVAAQSFERHHAIAGDPSDAKTVIRQRGTGQPGALNRIDRRDRRVRRALTRGLLHQDGVDAPVQRQLALQQAERHEHHWHRRLAGHQRELAQAIGGERPGQRHADASAPVVTSPLERAERDVLRSAHAQHQRIPVRGAELRGEAFAQCRLPPRQRHVRHAVERPERIVDAVDLHARGDPARRGVRDRARHRDEADSGAHGVRSGDDHAVSQPLAEAGEGGHRQVGGAEALQGELAQAGADRDANEQGAGEDRHRHRDAGCDQHVQCAVVPQRGARHGHVTPPGCVLRPSPAAGRSGPPGPCCG